MDKDLTVKSGSGNVFADLGLPNADELLLKAKLADQISDIISQRQLTQTEAAELRRCRSAYSVRFGTRKDFCFLGRTSFSIS